MEKHLESLGEPVIKIASLSVWVHGYEFPEATDGWDGNWLRVTARCVATGSSVFVTGAILDTVSFAQLKRELDALQQGGAATLRSSEPNLNVSFAAKGKGQIGVEIEITPDHLSQRHRFIATIDQSYLPAIRKGCDAVLRQFPVRDPASRGIDAG